MPTKCDPAALRAARQRGYVAMIAKCGPDVHRIAGRKGYAAGIAQCDAATLDVARRKGYANGLAKRDPTQHVTGDTTYGTLENIVAIEDAGIRAYVPLPDFAARTPFFGQQRFTDEAARDQYRCPSGAVLHWRPHLYTDRVSVYRADAATGNTCLLQAQCTASERGRTVRRHFDEAYLERVRGYIQTAAYQHALGQRRVWVEPLFGEAKAWHGGGRFRLRTWPKVNIEGVLIAAGQNVKRLLQQRGWGHRPGPTGLPWVAPFRASLLIAVLTEPGWSQRRSGWLARNASSGRWGFSTG